jgi:bacillithiol biosynthesis deacetylase BshB1
MQKLDILVIAAHPDDAELGCGGTICSHVAQGKKIGIIDLTEGELGSNGTVATRYAEAAKASDILGVTVRKNMRFRDGFFVNDEAHQLAVIQQIRAFQPDIILSNAPKDRHPDHAKGAELVKTACFLAGLKKITTHHENGQAQAAWRPRQLFHFIQSEYLVPDFIVDISAYWEQKMEAVYAYSTQFYNPKNPEQVQTFIATPAFLKMLEGRAADLGQSIGKQYGEGFIRSKPIGITDLSEIL